jgi:hypothetical protein
MRKYKPVLTLAVLLLQIVLEFCSAWAQSGSAAEAKKCKEARDRSTCGDDRSTALRFTADGQFVQIPASGAIDEISSALTIEAWVKPEAGILTRGYTSILSKQLNGTGYMLATNIASPDHRFKAEVDGIQVTSGSQPAINGWQHVAAVWDGGELKIYVNGQFDGMIKSGPPLPNSLPLWIGSSPFGIDTTWRGSIDEVRIWAVARSQDQIQSNMNQYLCGQQKGLRAYWSFDEGSGQEVKDSFGESDGIVSGPEWVTGVHLLRSPRCKRFSAP